MTLAPTVSPAGPFLRRAIESCASEGSCFFDSALPSARDSLSVLATAPSGILRGSIFSDEDAGRIRHELKRLGRTTPEPGEGVPGAGLYGFVDYRGEFTFGVYPKVEVWWSSAGIGQSFHQGPFRPVGPMVARMGQEAYRTLVGKALAYIGAGDIYQVNLARAFSAALPEGVDEAAWVLGFYERLRGFSPAPFAALLRLDGQAVASSSPECFLDMKGRRIRTMPIKGTRPRQTDPVCDEAMRLSLLASEKERAELLMITDLKRNDLGRSCEYGSVRVADLARVETFAHVHHLVATIEGRLRSGVDHLDALRGCFPGGSITGAPKKRAMEIIGELEEVPRGIYTGAIGWLGAHGFSKFNIAIRTAVISRGVIRFHTGAGIVSDSDPHAEVRETAYKARGLFDAAGADWSEEV